MKVGCVLRDIYWWLCPWTISGADPRTLMLKEGCFKIVLLIALSLSLKPKLYKSSLISHPRIANLRFKPEMRCHTYLNGGMMFIFLHIISRWTQHHTVHAYRGLGGKNRISRILIQCLQSELLVNWRRKRHFWPIQQIRAATFLEREFCFVKYTLHCKNSWRCPYLMERYVQLCVMTNNLWEIQDAKERVTQCKPYATKAEQNKTFILILMDW
jgi:hypothetical protein